jgi:hypothetical protein
MIKFTNKIPKQLKFIINNNQEYFFRLLYKMIFNYIIFIILYFITFENFDMHLTERKNYFS